MEVVLVDTSQIQSYIFGSNRLRENVGASFLVSLATRDWPRDTKLLKDSRSGRIIYSGGGNVLAAFDSHEDAGIFIRSLSERILTEAPGLQVAIAQKTQNGNFLETYKALQKQLHRKKYRCDVSVPLLGLGVTRRCDSTGLPANGLSYEDPNDVSTSFPASSEVIAKNNAAKDANEFLRRSFPEILGSDYEFPWQLDKLGRSKGQHSYIAVVHIDGDGVGQRIQEMVEANPMFESATKLLSKFSNSLDEIGKEALTAVLIELKAQIEEDSISHKRWVSDPRGKKYLREIARVELTQADNGRSYLPFRPIIFGGDDLTFVCDGRLGIALALKFMKKFEMISVEKGLSGGKATASAGIAIVKTHYPFARAYALAEQLCQNAKSYKRQEALDCACFDWHFARSGLSGDLDQIRDRELVANWGDKPYLHNRPYSLAENPNHKFQAWPNLNASMQNFQDPLEWLERRNKLYRLSAALRRGPKHVAWFRQKYNKNDTLSAFDGSLESWPETGWDEHQGEQKCGYYDALELADWYMPLEKNGEDKS